MTSSELWSGWDVLSAIGAAWLLTYALHSTALLGMVWGLDRLGALRSLRLRDLAWRGALVGGLLTATVQMSAGLAPWGGMATLPSLPVRPEGLVEASRNVENEVAPAPSLRSPRTPAVERPRSVPESSPVTAAEAPAPSPSPQATGEELSGPPRLQVGSIFFMAWAAGATVLLLRLAIVRARLLERIGLRAPAPSPGLRRELEQLCQAAGIRREIRFTTAAGLQSPVALGWSEICVPEAVLTDLGPAEQRSVLAHEFSHLRRLDPLWLLLGTSLEQLLFFQPLNRLARLRLQETAEFLCDDWAALREGSGLAVAKGLASVASWLDATERAVPFAGMMENRSQLVTRVQRLLARASPLSEPARLWHLALVGGLLLATLLIVPGVRAASAPRASSEVRTVLASGASAEAPPRALDATSAPRSAKAALTSATVEAAVPAEAAAPTPAHALNAVSAPRSAKAALTSAPADLAVPGEASAPASGVRSVTSPRRIRAGRSSRPPEAPEAPEAPEPPQPPEPPTAPDRPSFADLGELGADVQAQVQRAAGEMRQAQQAQIEAQRELRSSMGRWGRSKRAAEPADPATLEALGKALKDPDAGVRAAAAESLGRIGDARSFDGLLATLADDNVDVRRAGLEAVAGFDDPRTFAPLTHAARDSDPRVRRAAVQALARSRDAKAFDPLVAALQDSDLPVRLVALEGLGQLRDKRAAGPLANLLKDPSVPVRTHAVRALGELRDPAAIPGLAAALKDASPEVRAAAARALGQLEAASASPELIRATQDSNREVRRASARALATIHPEGAVPALRKLLEDSDSEVRESAVEGLAAMRDAQAQQALIAAMQSKDIAVRKAAAEALGQRR